jgi:hypothetical protein
MKKVLIILFVFAQVYTYGQFSFTDLSGNTIADGSTLTYETANSESAKLKFLVTNVGTNPIDVRIKCTGITGGNGVGFQLCYGGLCHDNVVTGVDYPDYQFILNAGENNGNFDYFVNNFVSSTPINFQFQVYSLDTTGFPTGQAVSFTYRYDSTLGLNSFENLTSMGINIENTTVKSDFKFNSTQSGNLSIFNLNGQLIKEYKFSEGNQNLGLSELSSAIYVANFSTTEGKTSSVKLIKN